MLSEPGPKKGTRRRKYSDEMHDDPVYNAKVEERTIKML